MIESASAYKLTCQGCGIVKLYEWAHTTDIRVYVRMLGWWIADQAQTIDHQVVWHVRCPACGEPTGPGEEAPTAQIVDLFHALKRSLR